MTELTEETVQLYTLNAFVKGLPRSAYGKKL
ncbi:hypothetical protein SAMN05216293_0415 [Flagellimonas taeanensis]|uniref:Uncharacterized protein n=1 Tax=Flagellimonas taeanensis TaxID=1005926 RepID=A0A1M6Q1M8_9FLAO|nr:hypothetical protein SAMN05216293_0415 [Allomuricauda taeanensis]